MTHGSCARVPIAPISRAQRTAVSAALVGALMLAGCAAGRSMKETASGWFDRMGGGSSAEGTSRVSYAAAAHTKVYNEPDVDSAVLGLLERYEEIARYQSVSGFAYVEAKGDLAGWVPESQLIERRPRARKPTEAEPAQPAEVNSPENEAPPPDAEAPTEPAPPDSGEEPQEPERSVFDPY